MAPIAIRYPLTLKTLTEVKLSGTGTVAVAALVTDQLILDDSGAGQSTIDQLRADAVTVGMSGEPY